MAATETAKRVVALIEAGQPRAVPKMRHSAALLRVARVRGLMTAGELIGQAALAEAMGVAPRTLRAYLAMDRSVSDAAFQRAVDAVRAREARLCALANALKALEAGE